MTERHHPYDASGFPPGVSLIPNAAVHQRWLEQALRFMVDTYGKPIDVESEDLREGWYQRLGLLVHFIAWEHGQGRRE